MDKDLLPCNFLAGGGVIYYLPYCNTSLTISIQIIKLRKQVCTFCTEHYKQNPWICFVRRSGSNLKRSSTNKTTEPEILASRFLA